MSVLRSVNKKNKDLTFFGVIYGRPGSGKTTLLSNAKDVFFIGNERNREFNVLGFEPCDTYSKFLEDLKNVEKHVDKFNTLVVDNFSDVEGLMKKEFTGGANLSTWNKGYGAGANECEARTRSILNSIAELRDKHKKNVIFICHAKVRNEEDLLTGAGTSHYEPDLEKKTLKPIEAYADFVFHLHTPVVISKKNKSSELVRFLFTAYSAGSHAKKKSFIDLPDEIQWNKKDTGLMNRLIDRIQGGLRGDADKPVDKPVDNKIRDLYEKASKVKKLPPLEEILKNNDKDKVVDRLEQIIKSN